MGKDVILRIAGDYGTDVGLYKAARSPVRSLKISHWRAAGRSATWPRSSGASLPSWRPDEKVYDFLKGRTDKPFTPVFADPDANYAAVYDIDVSRA